MPTLILLLLALGSVACAVEGYTDTPVLPGQPWRVHDPARPQPPIVDPGPAPARPATPPADAIVLFDGRDASRWRTPWRVEDGALVAGGGDLVSVDEFGDCQLHLEWCAPLPAAGSGQGRGNSGVFLMERYEVQILDGHGNQTYPDGQAAAIYGQHPPLVNACRPAGEWQTYDIVFRRPRFAADGWLREPALLTVLHNGVLVHHARPLLGATAHRTVAAYAAHGDQAPLRLQDHGNPVRFRSIWVRRLADEAPAP